MADILFVMKYPLNGQETLIPKFQGQMAAMERLGHRAWYLGWAGWASFHLLPKLQ